MSCYNLSTDTVVLKISRAAAHSLFPTNDRAIMAACTQLCMHTHAHMHTRAHRPTRTQFLTSPILPFWNRIKYELKYACPSRRTAGSKKTISGRFRFYGIKAVKNHKFVINQFGLV